MHPDPWELGTWEGLERHQLREDMRLPFAVKLQIVEEMEDLALEFEAARKRMKEQKDDAPQ